MSIKYIILEGGGYKGLATLGALHELHKAAFYDIVNIQGIYGTSAGAFIGAMLCLKIEWSIILDYIKNRPWQKIVSFKPNMILESISKKGIFDIHFFRESMKNLLCSVDFTVDVTLQELYDYSKIELHIFSTEVNSFSLVDFSYKTVPNMKLVEAIYKSSTLPFIFQPMWYKNSYYLDGGLINNYPVNVCIEDGAKPEEILGIEYKGMAATDTLPEGAHLLEFAFYLYKKIFRILRKTKSMKLPYEITIASGGVSISECQNLLENAELRQTYISLGRDAAKSFLLSKT